MTTTIFRGGLIGCGFFAINQLEAWRQLDGAGIVAICDRDPDRLAHVGDRFGISARYVDAEEMLGKERLDFVDVATTPSSHRALVELAARHGVGIICQKPIAPTSADADIMVGAAERAGVPFMVHENFRWQTPILRVKEALGANRIGTPFWARISFRSAFDVYSGQPYLAEGERFIIEDLGIHVLDVARFLLGEAASITARTCRVNPRIRGEDVATMMLDHVDGATSIVDCSYASLREHEHFPETLIEIEGESGSLALSGNYRLSVTTAAGTEHLHAAPRLLPWAETPWHNIQESVLNIQAHWVEVLRAGRVPDTNGRDNLKTFGLVQAAYESASRGETVRLAP